MSQETKSAGAGSPDGMRVKSNLKAGGTSFNHSQTAKGLRVKSAVKAGGLRINHNQTVRR